MDGKTLGAAVAIIKNIPSSAAQRAEAAASAAEAVLDSIPEDYSELSADVSDLKTATESLEAEVPLKVNKPTASHNGTSGQFLKTNGDGTTVWADPLEEPVADAVDDWLDAHPEATTTVEDGSLTQAKFSSALQLATIKDYVTPEMYGAKGDGTTDDTQAIQDALDSGSPVVFGQKTYLCAGVSITSAIELYFNNTTLKAKNDNQEFVVKTSKQVVSTGWVNIQGDNKAIIGYYIDGDADRSNLAALRVYKCKVWGVYFGTTYVFHIGFLSVSGCGVKSTYAITRTGNYTCTVDSGNKAALFADYMKDALIVDQSDYHKDSDGYVIPWNRVWRALSFAQDENATTGTITLFNGTTNIFASDYTGDRLVYILIGGGIGWSVAQGGAAHIGYLNSINNACGLVLGGSNRNTIDFMYSQSDGIPVACPWINIGTFIGNLGVEGAATGIHVYGYNYSLITIGGYEGWSADLTTVAGPANFNSEDPLNYTCLFLSDIALRCNPEVSGANLTNIVINEKSPDINIIKKANKIKIKLNYKNTTMNSRAERYPFGCKTFYLGNKDGTAYSNSTLRIELESDLITAGYTLQGGTDGAMTLDMTNETDIILRIMKVGSKFIVAKDSYSIIT